MTRAARPPSLLRFFRRPLWWLGAATVVMGLLFVSDLRWSNHEREDFRDAIRVRGRVADSYESGPSVPVSYFNPLTKQRVTTDAYILKESLLPRGKHELPLLVSRDDPDYVLVAGDSTPPTAGLPAYLPLLLLPAAAWVLRAWRIRSSEALMEAPVASYAMIGNVSPAKRRGWRCDLHLYALDQIAGGPSTCSIRLASTAGVPIGGPGFNVEVKGRPLPGGRVVARVGEEVLWPAGRALLRSSGRRPDRILEPAPFLPADGPDLIGAHSSNVEISETGWLRAAALEIAGLLAAIAFAASVTVSTLDEWGHAKSVTNKGTPVLATVTKRIYDESVVVRYRLPTEARPRTTEVPVYWPEDYSIGRKYPAHVDPNSADFVILDAEPYEPVEPILWGLLPLLAMSAVVFKSRAHWVRRGKLRREGSWMRAVMTPLEPLDVARDPFGICAAGPTDIRCAITVAWTQAESLQRGPVPVLVAGQPEPGGLLAVKYAGLDVAVMANARAPSVLELQPLLSPTTEHGVASQGMLFSENPSSEGRELDRQIDWEPALFGNSILEQVEGLHYAVFGTLLVVMLLATVVWAIWAGGPPTWIALGSSFLFAVVAARLTVKRDD